MSDLTPAEKRAVEATAAWLAHRKACNAFIDKHGDLEAGFHRGYLQGDRDGYRRGVEAALAKLGCPDREATVFDSEIECVRFDIRDHIRALLAQEESRG